MQCNKRHARAAMIYSITSSAPGALAAGQKCRALWAAHTFTYSTFVNLRLAGLPAHSASPPMASELWHRSEFDAIIADR
jgi:hypothetical protein